MVAMKEIRNMDGFMDFACKLADASRAVIKESLSSAGAFETKSDSSPVTVVDRKVEQTLRAMIAAEYPDHGILGEEYESDRLNSEYVWVIDPIDGTKAFITGMPIYGTLISLTRDGVPVLGVIDQPATNERWAGMEGRRSTHNGRPVSCRACTSLSEAIISIGNPESLNPGEASAFAELRKQSKWGIYGGNCYVYGRLAMGAVDISLDSGLDVFDYCALDAVVRGAGGCMTDWEGERLTIRSGHRVIAAGDPEIHRRAVEILKNS